MQHLRYDILDSSNAHLMQLLRSGSEDIHHGTIVSCGFQGAGRGQMGNSWESEAGANALFSIALRQLAWPAMEHFRITQAIALAVCDALCQDNRYLPETCHKDLRIKWPNDIYFQDKKLAGILIESQLAGPHIQDCICGIGLNVKQEIFLSNAPNPCSLQSIAKHHQQEPWFEEEDIIHLIEVIGEKILQNIQALCNKSLSDKQLHESYLGKLYRYQTWHSYQDKEGTFEARILDVLPSGEIQVEKKADGAIKNYAFKELQFII